MRDGWTETTLGDISEVIGGGTPSTSKEEFWDGDVVWLTPTEVTAIDGKVISDSKRKITQAGLQSSGARVLPKGTVILTSRASVGFVALAGTELTTNQGFQSLIPSGLVDGVFLMFWIQMNRAEFESRSAGSTFKEISKSNVKSIAMNLPPLEEQKRIVDVVSSVDAYIAALQQQVDAARTARNAVLHELLSAGGDDWSETTLGDIATWGSGGTPKSVEPAYYDGDIPWCVIGDLTEGEVFLTEKCITSEGLKNSSAKIVEPGAVMIAMYGASIGRTGIVGQPMATNQAIAFAYPSVETLENWFLLSFLQTQKSQFVEAGQGAAQPNISQTVLKAWPILLPPLDEQERIVGIVSSMDDVIKSTEQSVADAKNLRSGLLSDLLSGEHEIPASYDVFVGAV